VDGYADDSAETDGAYVLAGWMSTAPRWADFSDDYEKAGLPRSLHMRTVRRLHGARVRKLAEITERHAAYRVDCLLHRGNYNNIVKGKLRPELDTPYFLLFFQVILAAARLLDLTGSDDTIDWIFDEQGKIGLEANNWYWFIKKNAKSNLKRRLGSTPIFRDDEKVLPLKAADLLAWQIRRHVAYEQPKGEPPSEILKSFLGRFGVSCNMKGEYLDELVQALNKDLPLPDRGLILKADCQFFLPRSSTNENTQ